MARSKEADTDHTIHFCATDQSLGAEMLKRQQANGVDKHSRAVDRLVVGPGKGDFRFNPGSPALKLGIVPIDLSKVGLHKTNE